MYEAKLVIYQDSKNCEGLRWEKRRSTANLTHARMLQHQGLRLDATLTESWMQSMRKELASSCRVKIRLSSICLLGEKNYAAVGYIELKRQGAVYHLKSCLVAKGHSQKPGIDYNDTASVGCKVIFRFTLTFALHLGYEIFQLDVDTAYFYCNLKETIYMRVSMMDRSECV